VLANLRQAPCSGLVNAARRKPGSICGVERDSDSGASEDDVEPDELHAATSPTKSRGARRATALVHLCGQAAMGASDRLIAYQPTADASVSVPCERRSVLLVVEPIDQGEVAAPG
jgi:hypothetical protein